MRSNASIHAAVFSTFFLLIACVPVTALSSTQNSHHNHAALAEHYGNLAAEMQVKAQEQKEILKNKPRTSYFGRNGQHIKKRVAQRIHNYEKAAEINLAKAADHKRIAQEQAKHEFFGKPGAGSEQIDKAKLRSNDSSSAEERTDFKESL